METARLKVKIGVHEFDAEGPPDQVAAQFQVWKELISANPVQPDTQQKRIAPGIPSELITEGRTREGFAVPWDIFSIDSDKDLMTLRVHPPAGDTRDADAILLVMYGYRRAGNEGQGIAEVPVTKLKESLDVSGIRIARIDRAAAPHLKAGYLLKAGRGKGGIYRLTNTGHAKADEMARRLFEQLV
ncbi:MAG: hypothetical protein HY651_08725 [Acidobacteria bacterium]|nr:hypothetical protein [Acidobacteriota bacterium]